MQTFLPEYSIQKSVKVLDNKRLQKQFLEGSQILKANGSGTGGWINHPATLMWKGHAVPLIDYLDAARWELNRRGVKTMTIWANINQIADDYKLWDQNSWPWWIDDVTLFRRVVVTHRGNLYRKNPEHYADYFVESMTYRNSVCCPRCNYFWPTHLEKS